MKSNYPRLVCTGSLILIICLAMSQSSGQQLITIPEKSNYQHTSTYAEVMAFIEVVSVRTGWHVFSMGQSLEGKEIPVVVLSDPPIKTPTEALASGKPVIYIQGNIHAGEVEGKEVLQLLMRDFPEGKRSHLLDHQILLFAPIYNTDSNDKMENGRRPSQEDSPLEVGIRANSQGWDLNRDGVKMEALETRALFTNVINKWDPQIFVDLHTTNGTWHGYSLTTAPSYHTMGEEAPYEYNFETLLPSVIQQVKNNYGIHIGPYGYYFLRQGWPPKAVYTYNHHPRYLVNQFGLRNRMAILSEAFAHERFYQRIQSTYAFVTEILEFTNGHAREILKLNKRAEERTIASVLENSGKITKGVRFEMKPLEKKLQAYRTYDYKPALDSTGAQTYLRTPGIVTYDNVDYYARFEAQ